MVAIRRNVMEVNQPFTSRYVIVADASFDTQVGGGVADHEVVDHSCFCGKSLLGQARVWLMDARQRGNACYPDHLPLLDGVEKMLRYINTSPEAQVIERQLLAAGFLVGADQHTHSVSISHGSYIISKQTPIN